MTLSSQNIEIEGKAIGDGHPTYFIADIAANHDGDLERAKDLIYLAAEAGADAAKFQHFLAETIVSDFGFAALGEKNASHQKNWNKPVTEVYRDASVPFEWTEELVATCKKAGITFMTSPYDIDIVNKLDEYLPAYKIGSGDITWSEIIELIASKAKPYILATGASNEEVRKAVSTVLALNNQFILMHCNTNYTGSLENLKYINLTALNQYRLEFPNVTLGLSDHTPGHSSVLGAICFGARAIEKHFTDDISRSGPDHPFFYVPCDLARHGGQEPRARECNGRWYKESGD